MSTVQSPLVGEYDTLCAHDTTREVCSTAFYALLSSYIYKLQQIPKPVTSLRKVVRCFGYDLHTEAGNLISDVIMVSRRVEDEVHAIIVHRGTDAANANALSDLQSYEGILTNKTSELSRKRTTMTERFIMKLNPDYIDVTGHSLGGWTAMLAIANSRLVQSKLRYAVLFNPGYVPPELNSAVDALIPSILKNHPLREKEKTPAFDLSKQEKDDLNTKVVIKINSHDPVSKGVLKGTIPFGKIHVVNASTEFAIKKQQLMERFLKAVGIPRKYVELIAYAKDGLRLVGSGMLGYAHAHSVSQHIPTAFLEYVDSCVAGTERTFVRKGGKRSKRKGKKGATPSPADQ